MKLFIMVMFGIGDVNNMKYFKEYNANPYGENIDDCVFRAISLVLDMPYWEVFDEICAYAGDNREPNNGDVFLNWLVTKGYEVREFNEKITLSKFLNEVNMSYKPDEFDALLLVNGHLTAIKGGLCYDTWDCGRYKCQLLIIKEDYLDE